jgi:FAD/FMN-containing dehydrogenase
MIHEIFQPAGSNGTGQGLAVTFGAGVQLCDMYKWLGEHDIMVVGGPSHGVGIAGEYIQGGGHSLLSAIAGKASDNDLEFNVVTADVSKRKHNPMIVNSNSYYRVSMSPPMPTRTPTSSKLYAEVVGEPGELSPQLRYKPLMICPLLVFP